MWPLTLFKKRHWIFLGLCVLFLLTYGGFISWAKVAQALEHLADQPAVRERFSTPIGRGEAIITSFMFFLLTPLAIAAALGIVAFFGAIGAGVLRAVMPLRDVPDYVFLTIAYVGVIIAIWLAPDFWTRPAYDVIGLIAKGILIATGPL